MRKVTICFYSNGLKLKVSINSNENTKRFNLRRERATGKAKLYFIYRGPFFFITECIAT